MRLFGGILVIAALTLFLAGCDGGSSSPTSASTATTTTSVPAGPSSAQISLTVLGAAYAASGQGNAVLFQIRLSESAGLGANINFVRVDVFRATGLFEERQEIGSGQIVAQTGSNRLGANETRELTVIIGFNATVKKGRIVRLTVGMTDDKGNDQTQVAEFVFG